MRLVSKLFVTSVCVALGLAIVTLAGGETRVSGRMISAADGRPLAGIIAIEKGRLYGKDFRYGGRVDEDGRFSVPVPAGGDFGLHLYATEHVYFALAVKLEEGKDNVFTFQLPPNAAAADAPAIREIVFEPATEGAKLVTIRLEASDPNGNLSHQVLAVNAATQQSFRLEPPGWVFPWTKDYPAGVYTLAYDPKDRPLDPGEWVFVAADNRCYTSEVRGHPFDEAGVIRSSPGMVASFAAEEEKPLGPEELRARGEKVFSNNCRICHYADSTETKVGPGLAGLFRRDLTPSHKLPVTEANIRKQIEEGSEGMPPYQHVRGVDQDALLEYLKGL